MKGSTDLLDVLSRHLAGVHQGKLVRLSGGDRPIQGGDLLHYQDVDLRLHTEIDLLMDGGDLLHFGAADLLLLHVEDHLLLLFTGLQFDVGLSLHLDVGHHPQYDAGCHCPRQGHLEFEGDHLCLRLELVVRIPISLHDKGGDDNANFRITYWFVLLVDVSLTVSFRKNNLIAKLCMYSTNTCDRLPLNVGYIIDACIYVKILKNTLKIVGAPENTTVVFLNALQKGHF